MSVNNIKTRTTENKEHKYVATKFKFINL